MVMSANMIALIAALIGSDRAWRVAVGNDQTLNAALVGKPGSEDKTVSHTVNKARVKGRRWGCVLCRVFDRFDPSHCEKSADV